VLTTGDPANAPPMPNVDQFKSPVLIATGNWSPPAYLNAEGVTAAAPSAAFRWTRRWRVVNLGQAQPYVISVTVTYNSDTGTPRTVRLDLERRKSWL